MTGLVLPDGPHGADAARARRLSPLTPLVRGFYLVVAFAVTSWDDVVRGHLGAIGWILAALLVGGAVYGLVSWLRTTYWLEPDELRVDTGLVSRRSRRVRVDRLQGIDVVQPFVARIFGLAELRFDVAGGGDEGSLAFLPLAEAEQVRAQLLARRDARRRARSPQVEPPSSVEPVETTPLVELVETTEPPPLVEPVETTEPEVVVGTLDPVLLVMSILLSTETAAFVVSALLVGGAVFLLGGGLAALGGAAGVITLVAGFAISAFRRLSSFYGFTLTRTSVGLQVRRGLLERTTQTFVLRRVQGVVVTEPWAWRLLGWARLDVAVARRVDNDGGGQDGAASTVMPVAPRAQVMALAALLLTASAGVEGEPVDPDAVPLGAPPDRARWVAPVRRRWLLGGADDHAVVSRHGLLTRRTHAVAYARLQSAHLRQSPWQRPLRLVDLVVDSPPGPVDVRLRHRDGAEARLLLERTMDRAREARVTADLGG